MILYHPLSVSLSAKLFLCDNVSTCRIVVILLISNNLKSVGRSVRILRTLLILDGSNSGTACLVHFEINHFVRFRAGEGCGAAGGIRKNKNERRPHSQNLKLKIFKQICMYQQFRVLEAFLDFDDE